MPVQRIPVRGGFYSLADRHWSNQDLLNMMSLPSETGGTKTELELVQAPGPRPFCEFGDGAIRGLRNVEGKLFAVAGTQLYQVSATGVAIPRGTIPGVGRVSMTHNQFGSANQLVIDNGSARYVFNTVTLVLEKVTDESFPGSFCAFYVDQYLGFVEPQGRYWGHSDLADALNYNALDTYEAEADPDRIISAYVSHREVLIFGKDTIEPFVNSPVGDGTAPFVRASNTVIECGCAAKFSVAGMDNSVFWLDDKRIVRRLDGYTPVRISNAGIEQALAECTPGDISRAYAFVYEERGFKVYYLTVPGQFTFGYDLRTQEWHRRSSPGRNDWRLSDLVFWEGQWIGGDRAAGRLYILDWDYSFDGTEELVREWSPGVLFADQRRIEINQIEVLASVGAPTETAASFPEQPEPPTITGDAPGGFTGEAYSFSYTLADGTPPYAVTLRSGTLPAGLTLSTAGVLSGTPTEAGESEWTVRVTDAEGLWDDLDDSALMSDGAWFAGPVNLNGASGGSTAYYLRSGSLDGLLTATPIALPANGTGDLSRVSVANGRVFLHRATAGSVSDDRGATWTACNNSLYANGWPRDVFWNGTNYYYDTLVSADGVTWSAIPNLPANSVVQMARESDGMVVVQDTSGVFHTSVDEGVNWVTALDAGTSIVPPIATDGTDYVFVSTSNFHYYSDDDLATASNPATQNGSVFGSFYSNGAWFAVKFLSGDGIAAAYGILRATDPTVWPNGIAAANFAFIEDGVELESDLMAFDGAGACVAWEQIADVCTLYASEDNGVTWAAAGTLYGPTITIAHATEVA